MRSILMGAKDGSSWLKTALIVPLQRSSALAASPWPMFRHDAAHSGSAVAQKRSRLVFLSPKLTLGGQFTAQLALESGETCQIQASTDLSTWVAIATISGSSAPAT